MMHTCCASISASRCTEKYAGLPLQILFKRLRSARVTLRPRGGLQRATTHLCGLMYCRLAASAAGLQADYTSLVSQATLDSSGKPISGFRCSLQASRLMSILHAKAV